MICECVHKAFHQKDSKCQTKHIKAQKQLYCVVILAILLEPWFVAKAIIEKINDPIEFLANISIKIAFLATKASTISARAHNVSQTSNSNQMICCRKMELWYVEQKPLPPILARLNNGQSFIDVMFFVVFKCVSLWWHCWQLFM